METGPPAGERIRLAELLAVLSLGADLGMGQPMEHAMRQCRIALRLGERLGLDRNSRESLYYVSLVAWVGCHIDAYEQAKWFGDDLALKGGSRLIDPVGLRGATQLLGQIGAGQSGFARAAVLARFFAGGVRDAKVMLDNHAYATEQLVTQLGLPPSVCAAVTQTFERHDGKGAPDGRHGDDIAMTARVVNLADVLAVFYNAGGVDAAVGVARQRSGTQFHPDLVELVACDQAAVFG